MRNNILTLLAITITLPALAQVTVKGTSFIYSKGTNIFVKEAINLDAGTHIYLRKEAQLIQDSNLPNTGAGELSVFQEGAANNYTYNYWSAPVGRIDLAGTGNQGFLNTQIKFPRIQAGFQANTFTSSTNFTALATDLVTDFQSATILSTSVRDGLTDEQNIGTAMVINPLRIASRWLYKYNNAGTGGGNGYASWQPFQTSAQVVEPGYGFTMKGVDPTTPGPNLFAQGNGIIGQRYDFRGRPNNGTITVRVVADDFALVGNPYPSALDLKRFIIDNTTEFAGALTAASQM
ncbi:MAG: hypothetical protein NWQ19_00510, partial [Nonlabens sp.]|nr:hypothetical protein [Nonlabens sp.]